MADNKPLVSIGMPVYNGERFIQQALDSLLAQDYKHFELIISDNASADRTADICKSYARRDARIRLYNNDRNIGPYNNFRKVALLARGKYFMWAADDDLWEANFVSTLYKLLSISPTAILAMSRVDKINPDGSYHWLRPEFLNTEKMSYYDRVRTVVTSFSGEYMYGLFRRKELSRILSFTPLREYSGTEPASLLQKFHNVVFIAASWGNIVTSPEILFHKRRAVGGVGDGISRNRITAIHWIRLFLNYYRCSVSCFDLEKLTPMQHLQLKYFLAKKAKQVVSVYYGLPWNPHHIVFKGLGTVVRWIRR